MRKRVSVMQLPVLKEEKNRRNRRNRRNRKNRKNRKNRRKAKACSCSECEGRGHLALPSLSEDEAPWPGQV